MPMRTGSGILPAVCTVRPGAAPLCSGRARHNIKRRRRRAAIMQAAGRSPAAGEPPSCMLRAVESAAKST